MTGQFITLEGSEGAGKTTNLEVIKAWLSRHQINHIVTREPGGTELGEQLRELLLQPRDHKMDEMAELLMVFAARAQHLRQCIEPALAAGQWVLCDRFTDATYAYQGGGRQMDWQLISVLENLVQKGLRPDAVLLLDLPVEQGLRRASKRGELDRFEQEDLAFFNRVRQAYLRRAADQANYYVINAGLEQLAVKQQVEDVLNSLLPEHAKS